MTNAPLLTIEKLTLQLRNPFRLSYGVSDTREAFWLRLRGDEGWGEGTIPPYYGVDQGAMLAFWEDAAGREGPLPEDLLAVEPWVGAEGPAPARCALELALYDRLGRAAGLPLWRMFNLPEPRALPTSFTIAIDTPEAMARMAAELARFPVLKIKLGGDGDDDARLAAIREARPDARIRVDANAGWDYATAQEYIRRFSAYHLELIEQPMAKGAMEEMGILQSQTDIPLVADESVQTEADVVRLADAGVAGVNIKLMKAGGLSAGLRMARIARERGMRVMLGCMVETSLGVTAMAHLLGLAEWVDLDAPMLITNDMFDGITYDEAARVLLPERPGIGVTRKETR